MAQSSARFSMMKEGGEKRDNGTAIGLWPMASGLGLCPMALWPMVCCCSVMLSAMAAMATA